MQSNITINIVEPGSGPTPDPVVPNTGLFTHGIGGPEATIIGAAIILTIAAIVVAVLYKKHKHQGKATKLVQLVDSCKAVIANKKRISAGLAAVALLVSAGTFAGLLVNAGKSNTSAAEGEDGLTTKVSSEDLTIEVGSEPVFAVLPVELTVEEATQAGYTLTAYADSTDLVSATDESKTIPMIAVEDNELTALTDNTYGLALAEPASQAKEVYTTLSTDADNPTLLAEKEGGTEANDTTTIYYGFYITPDTPYGTYTSGDVYYDVEENPVLATVIYNGNGLYYNGNPEQSTNNAKYSVTVTEDTKKYSSTPNIGSGGVKKFNLDFKTSVNKVVTIPGASKLNIRLTYGGGFWYDSWYGYLSFWSGPHPDYKANINYETGIKSCGDITDTDGRFATDSTEVTVECEIAGDTVTFDYWTSNAGPGGLDWYGYYVVATGYDADGNVIRLPENNLISGNYLTPSSEGYSRFMGWDKNPEATAPTYVTEEDIEKELALVPGGTTTLYAIWEPAFTIVYNGNGASSATNMNSAQQYTTALESNSKSVDLLASNFTREGYGFTGWSTDADAWVHLTNDSESDDPTIYGPNQTITVDPSASTKLNLYAVWVPVETTVSGKPVELQSWQGCDSLTATTYDAGTGELNVGKNTITALADNRDGNIYTVARLADGNCWTTENLRLSDGATISTANTNNPTVREGTTNVAIKNNDGNTSNHLSPTNSDWCTRKSIPEQDALCYSQSYLNTSNVASTATSPVFRQDFTTGSHNSNFDANITNYGNYYNWYSATAGNGKYETGSQGAEVVSGDICPTGWMLPYGEGQHSKGDTKGGFYYLGQQMSGKTTSQGSNNFRSFPNNLVYSGTWSSSLAQGRGHYGYYWTSTSSGDNNYAFRLYFDNERVSPGADYFGNRYSGESVRCVTVVSE